MDIIENTNEFNTNEVLTDVPELEYNDTYDENFQFEKNVFFDY